MSNQMLMKKVREFWFETDGEGHMVGLTIRGGFVNSLFIYVDEISVKELFDLKHYHKFKERVVDEALRLASSSLCISRDKLKADFDTREVTSPSGSKNQEVYVYISY